jgi:chromodomain-helicase-DNA-binding protein 1
MLTRYVCREFLSSIWPVGDYQVSGKRLQRMFRNLLDQDKKKTDDKSTDSKRIKRVEKNADLEDGEIASDREERRARDPYRDDRRDHRREERQEPKRPNYYENGGDRLNFYRHRRDGDRVPVRPSWQSRPPQARNNPY